jgi:hypothetical protein
LGDDTRQEIVAAAAAAVAHVLVAAAASESARAEGQAAWLEAACQAVVIILQPNAQVAKEAAVTS